ncbi:MAG TPA: alcohol dehydrogenase catalytic domain-containing protein [Streptosporangiales bacterium]
MKAVVYTAPGELRLTDVPVPRPAAGEVLVEVGHVGICGSDLLVWEGGLDRVRPPVVLGHEFCGTVVDANGCGGVRDGQRVAVEPLLNCGRCLACRAGHGHVCRTLRVIGVDVDGAAARYVTVPAARLHALPDGVPLRDAALTEPTSVAVHMVRRSGVGPGDRVLVLGGGPIGVLVALVARTNGVADLVVSEPNPRRRERLAGFGFDTFDPGAGGVETLLGRTDGEGFDVVFEVAGVAATLAAAPELARVRGTILLGGLPHRPVEAPFATAVMREQHLVGSRVYESRDMADAVELIASRRIPVAGLVTREVSLTDAIPDAYEVLRAGRDELKILVTPGAD